MDYYNKYLKYKTKYLQIGGSLDEFKNKIDGLVDNGKDIQFHIITTLYRDYITYEEYITNDEIIEKLNTKYGLNNYLFLYINNTFYLIYKFNPGLDPDIDMIWYIYKNILENNEPEINDHFIRHLHYEFDTVSKLPTDSKLVVNIIYDDEVIDEDRTRFNFTYNQKEYTFIDGTIFSFHNESETIYKIWFDLPYLQDKEFKIFHLLQESEKIHDMNLDSWHSFKFFQDGPPYNIIIYLNSDVIYESYEFYDIIDTIFHVFNTDQIKMGYSYMAHSPTIATIYNPRNIVEERLDRSAELEEY